MTFKFLLPAFLLAMAPVASAQNMLVPLGAQRSYASANDGSVALLFSEDFSKMSAGSENEPDSENIADKRTGAIPASFTSLAGWSGAAVYQAGGTCAIRMGRFSDGNGGVLEETGFLRTPQGAYAGNVTLRFRARLLDADAVSDKMDIALLNTAGRLETAMVDVLADWKNFEVNFTKGEFTGCLIQMSMLAAEVLVDDITVTAVQNSIPAPEATVATNYVPGGFTANWEPVGQAESYELSVYEKKVAEAVTIEDFENLNILAGTNKLDKDNPGFTNDWSIAYGLTRNADHVSDHGYEGSTGMIFRATGEGLITPTFDRPILDFSFYAAHPSGEECLSTIVVSVLVDDQWGVLGNYDVERIAVDGEIIRLSSNFPSGVKAVQLYFRKNDLYDAGKDVSIVVDHICIMTDPPATLVKTIPVESTSYDVDGLDLLKDYSYTVKALNENFVSKESNEVTASGLPAPALMGGSEVTANGYSANWEPSPKADGYVVSNYRVYTVKDDVETVDILHETFDKVEEGSIEAPVGLYNVVHPRNLDAYTINPGWMGIATYLARGMIGTRSYMGITGMIQTPALDLSGDGGRFQVHVRVIGDSDATDEMLVVQAGMEEFLAFPIKAGEMVEHTYDFECGSAGMPLALYSYNGFPFYIDEISVTQTLPSGTKVFSEIENRLIEGVNSNATRFEGLDAASDNYAYRVFAYRDFMGSRVYSVSDAAAHVYLNSAIETLERDDCEMPAYYFRLDGRAVDGIPSVPGIYIRKTPAQTNKIVIR